MFYLNYFFFRIIVPIFLAIEVSSKQDLTTLLWGILLILALNFTLLDHSPFDSSKDNFIYKLSNQVLLFVLFIGFINSFGLIITMSREKVALRIMIAYSCMVGALNVIQVLNCLY